MVLLKLFNSLMVAFSVLVNSDWSLGYLRGQARGAARVGMVNIRDGGPRTFISEGSCPCWGRLHLTVLQASIYLVALTMTIHWIIGSLVNFKLDREHCPCDRGS